MFDVMNNYKDLSGRAFGLLKVIKNTGKKSPTSGYIYECRCECGNVCEIRSSYLTRGDTKSCGCKTSYWNSKNNGGTGIAGESTELEKVIRLTPAYKEWILACIKRSGFKSELSGLAGKLEVHHKNSISNMMKTLNITKENYKSCIELYDINNGIVLTREEHKYFHKQFGLVTTEDMWKKFELNRDSYLPLIEQLLTKKRELKFNEFAGKVVGSLTLIEEISDGKRSYCCKCSCGNEKIYSLHTLKRNNWTFISACGAKHGIRKDFTGEIFGNWTVLKFEYMGEDHKARYLCRCICGKEGYEVIYDLKERGKNASCGCCRRMNIIGNVYNELTVIDFSHIGNGTKAYYLCRCSCGKEKNIQMGELKRGTTKSCGCKKSELISQAVRKNKMNNAANISDDLKEYN